MEDTEKSRTELLAEIQNLRDRLASSEETLQAIQQGEVDALIVSTSQGERVFTLQSADQSYRLLVEAMSQGAVILSQEGLVLYCNRSFADLLKQPLEKLIGSQFEQLISPPALSLLQALMQQAERGQRHAIELFLTTPMVELPVYLSINYLNLGESSIYCVVVTDLTEQKRYEEILASERLARLILEQAGEAILVCDHTGQIIRASKAALQLWGNPLLPQSFDTFPPLYWASSHTSLVNPQAGTIGQPKPETNPPLRASFDLALVLGGESYQGLEVELNRPDGQVLSLVLNARPLSDRDNNFRGAVIILTDITHRRQTEVALQKSQLQLHRQLAEIEAIYQSAPIGLNVLDTDLRFIRINQHLAEMNGHSVEAHLGRTVQELLPDLADTAEQVLRSVLETGHPLLNVEITGETPAQPGVQRTWVESFLPLKNGDRVIGISTVCEEITERKQIEEELRRAKAELESRVAERTKDLQKANDRLQQELLQRAQVEQQLRQSETRYRAIVEDQTELIVRFSPDSTLLFVNEAYCRYFNLQREEVIGKSYSPIVYETDRDRVAQSIQSMNAAHPTLTIENRVIDGRGEVRWTQWANRMLFDAEGSAIEFQAVGRDITDLKQVEQALRQSEEQRRLALDLTRLGFWDFHLPSGKLTWNDNHFTLLGLPAGLAPPRYEDWRDCIHPEDVERVEQIFTHSIEAHIGYEAEYRVVHPNGSVHWLLARGKALYDEQNQPLRSLGVILDISDRKQMEAALRESDRRWRLLLDNVQLAVIELDVQGTIKYANPFLLNLLEYSLDDVLGEHWFSRFLSPGQASSAEAVFRDVLKHNFSTDVQNPILTRTGEERMITWSHTVLRDVSGQAIGMISIGEDITQRYKVEQMKAEFIAVVSHELRTPLTSMQAALSLLSEKIIDPTSAEGEATIQIATEGTDRLVRLVNDILDLERLESGQVRLKKHCCNVGILIETAIAQMQELAKQAEIMLIANPCTFQVKADGDRLLQVLTNLLSNAIKFSPSHSVVQIAVEPLRGEGEIRRRGHQETSSRADRTPSSLPPSPPAPLTPCLLFTVRDQGRGIPSDSLENIFDRFHQVDASDSREKGGTGLGLAICRSIVQQHGGDIWVESTLGKGSTFYFTLPGGRAENQVP
ncbi:MAG: PAS domain S-box protein [Kovacikia sp.]